MNIERNMCNNIRIFLFLIILFLLIKTTNETVQLSTHTFPNRSLLINRKIPTIYSWKKSNSIEILKKLIANRQHNRTSLFTSTTHRITFSSSSTPINTTVQANFLLTNPRQSLNIPFLATVFLCCFLLTLMFTIILRHSVNNSYFKLPCIHSLSITKQSRSSTPLSYSSIDSRFTIPEEFFIDQLYDIYIQKHAFDDLGFSVEFRTVPNYDELPCTSATRSIVASKNRFINILPIDTTRVVLDLVNNDPSTDYINGNYISGYKCSNKFIATQGPKPDTCEDFWRMIWELKLKSIVMLTNVIEGALQMTKCHQYWPELNETITYGSYQITCVDKKSLCDYEKRLFQLTKINNDKEISPSSSLTINDTSSLNSIDNQQDIRLIIQYHYTQWKDMDVPNDSYKLLHLIHEVNEHTNAEQYPIVVHCTAGVGRTGTYIAIDAMIEKLKYEGKIDIFNFVSQMRQERHLMVQTVKQYVFIYRTLLEYYLYGNTRIERNIFQSVYLNLKKNKQLLLISEYNKLSLLPNENVSHHEARLSENIDKNRHDQIIPFDHNRVCLSRILGHPYINASFIEGYSLILTQDPLSETIDEFWRIFNEYDTNCIIQLHTVIETKPKCASYYPNDIDSIIKIGSTSLLKLLTKEVIDKTYIVRQFSLIDTRENFSKIIFHYEYLLPIAIDDNIQCIPTRITRNLFELIKQIINQSYHITIHCGNGGPAVSIFCMCIILIQQLKTEHAIDIFQSVRALQRQRPGMITSFKQYEFLYEMIDKYLEESIDFTSSKSSLSLNNSIYDNDIP